LVEITKNGRLDQVSAGLALAVYRIAQEALTNVVRHAGVQRAELGLAVSEGGLTLVVSNGPAEAPGEGHEGGGHGLAGMRERVSLYGGTLDAGPREDGGYRVEARFPAVVAEE
jgi:signal transduction histidine kinase